MKKLGGYQSSLLRKTRRVKQQLQKDTQQLRQKILADLERMFDIAKQAVEAAGHDKKMAKQVQHWIRIMAYLGQVMDNLAESLDEAKALQYLERLERMVREAERNQTESGTA